MNSTTRSTRNNCQFYTKRRRRTPTNEFGAQHKHRRQRDLIHLGDTAIRLLLRAEGVPSSVWNVVWRLWWLGDEFLSRRDGPYEVQEKVRVLAQPFKPQLADTIRTSLIEILRYGADGGQSDEGVFLAFSDTPFGPYLRNRRVQATGHDADPLLDGACRDKKMSVLLEKAIRSHL